MRAGYPKLSPLTRSALGAPGSHAVRIDAAMKYRRRYPALTYFRQLCASLNPSTSRAFRFESGAS